MSQISERLDNFAIRWLESNVSDREKLKLYLNNKIPNASEEEVRDTLDCFTPSPIPKIPSIVANDSENWYAEQKHHINYPEYFNKTLKLPPRAKISIKKSSEDILNLTCDPSSADFHSVSGLVVGNVQSGKTANFTALIARAADSGYNLIVVLSGGNFNDLRSQTQSRLFDDLIDPVNSIKPTWHRATRTNEWNFGDVMDEKNGWDGEWDITQKPCCLVVTKKNSSTLPNLRTWIKKIAGNMPDGKKIKLLLIDDEADHASLNRLIQKKKLTKEEKELGLDASKINRSIREILHEVSDYAYIGFTASPFANLFVPPHYDELEFEGEKLPTLYPRDFIYLLEEPEGYFGLAKLCNADFPEWTNHFCEVSENEAVFYRKHTTKIPVSESLKNGLKQSIHDFYITLGLRYIRRKLEATTDASIIPRNFHHSMLVHTRETTKTMYGITQTIIPFSNSLKASILESGSPIQTKDVKEHLEEFENHFSKNFIPKTPSVQDSFEDICANLCEYFDSEETNTFPHVKEIISQVDDPDDQEKKRGENLVYQKNHPYSVIAIGGNRLARGFTLEGLTVSYFIREPKSGIKSDTLLQQGRWYGFRGSDEDLVRVYTTRILRDEFWDLKRIEEDCHAKIREFSEQGLAPSCYSIPVLKTANQSPTSKDKIPHLRVNALPSIFSGDYLPKNGDNFPIKQNDSQSEAFLEENLTQLGIFLDECNILNGGKPFLEENMYVYNSIPLEAVMAYFKSTLHNYHGDVYQKKDLITYLQTRSEMNKDDCSKWTVALIGKAPPKNLPIPTTKLGAHSYELCLVTRSRTERNSNKLGYFTQTKHFAIGLDDTATSIQENCRARKSSNPILLIYLIDKSSKATSEQRAHLNIKNHLVALAVGMPSASKLSDKELENLNVNIWENGKLKSTYTDV